MYEFYERLLKERRLTTADVCKATGIGQATISTWKKRNGMLGAEYLLKLAKFFQMPVEYFITGDVITWNGNEVETYTVFTQEEEMLINKMRNIDPAKRMAIYTILDLEV